MCGSWSQVIKELSRHFSVAVVARGKPYLGPMSLIEIILSARTAHLGGNPARVNRVRQNILPAPGDSERQQRVVKFAVRVGLRSVPRPFFPQQVFESGIAGAVKAGAQVNEALRLVNQRGQHIGRESIDGEHVRKTIFGHVMWLTIANGRIVNDRVKAAELVCLLRDVAYLGNNGEITDDDSVNLRRFATSLVSPVAITRVQNDLMSLLEQKLRGH